jgi:pre-mRNA-splicing helicase BRR2
MWWLVVCDKRANQLISIKRATVGRQQQVTLEFNAPNVAGTCQYTLFLMCDSYVGVDQEHEVNFKVKDAMHD